MKELYLLLHTRNVSGYIDVKEIGVFNTRKKLNKTRRICKHLPGFKNYKNGFSVKKAIVDYCEINNQHYQTKAYLNRVYFVYHIFEDIEEDYTITTFVGCFSTKENANTAISNLQHNKIFNSGVLEVFDIQINRVGWSEGFKSIDDLDKENQLVAGSVISPQ